MLAALNNSNCGHRCRGVATATTTRRWKASGVSFGELSRHRCEHALSDDESLLTALVAELTCAVTNAKQSLEEGLKATQDALNKHTGHG